MPTVKTNNILVRVGVWLFFLLAPVIVLGQNITNAGTDFWLAFTMTHDQIAATYKVNISSLTATSGTVSIPGTGFSQNFAVVPGIVTQVTLPPADATITSSEVIESKAIHVVTNDDVVVYANTFVNFRSEASLVLPVPALGNSYRVMTYEAQQNGQTFSPSEFVIVAAGQTTTVEITPTANTTGGQVAGVPFTVTLNSGEAYQVLSATINDDLTGTLIRSLNPNEEFAVFAGNRWADVFCGSTRDPLYEACFPISTWGKDYIIVPTPEVALDVYRVMASVDNTTVLKNGVVLGTINAGQFIEDSISTGALISADEPISVGMFMITGNNCGGNPDGDPSMIILNPNEQMFLDTITFYTVDEAQINVNNINVVTRTNDTGTIFFNGALVTGYEILQADPTYSYVSFQADTGSHTLATSGCGFLAYTIGLGNLESYAYAAGVLLVDLGENFSFSNISTGSDTICVGDSILFASSASGSPISWNWDFGDTNTGTGQNVVHEYQTPGSYPIRLITEYTCQVDTAYDTLQVISHPSLDLGNDTILCFTDSLQLNAQNPGMQYLWFPNGETTQTIIAHGEGKYAVRVNNGSTCVASDTISITVPVVTNQHSIDPIDTNLVICSGDSIRYTGISDGEVITWDWDFGDNFGSSDSVDVHAYDTGGLYNVFLTIQYLCDQDTLVEVRQDTLRVFTTPSIDIGVDSLYCFQQAVTIIAGISDYDYLWFPDGDTLNIKTINTSGTYSVIASNEICSDTDTVEIEFANSFFVPNVFTPNADGFNDFFLISGDVRCQSFENLKIYSRWGALVFETDHPLLISWDGRSTSGEELDEGVYYYILKGIDGELKGSFTLLK